MMFSLIYERFKGVKAQLFTEVVSSVCVVIWIRKWYNLNVWKRKFRIYEV